VNGYAHLYLKPASDNEKCVNNKQIPCLLGGLGLGQKFFDTSVFENPLPGQTGNAGRNSLRGPGYRNYNATVSRIFALSERFRLQVQATAFNVTNTPHCFKA
jgi:hypothetical protein